MTHERNDMLDELFVPGHCVSNAAAVIDSFMYRRSFQLIKFKSNY